MSETFTLVFIQQEDDWPDMFLVPNNEIDKLPDFREVLTNASGQWNDGGEGCDEIQYVSGFFYSFTEYGEDAKVSYTDGRFNQHKVDAFDIQNTLITHVYMLGAV